MKAQLDGRLPSRVERALHTYEGPPICLLAWQLDTGVWSLESGQRVRWWNRRLRLPEIKVCSKMEVKHATLEAVHVTGHPGDRDYILGIIRISWRWSLYIIFSSDLRDGRHSHSLHSQAHTREESSLASGRSAATRTFSEGLYYDPAFAVGHWSVTGHWPLEPAGCVHGIADGPSSII